MQLHKLDTVAAYDANSDFWDKRFKISFEKLTEKEAELFLSYLPGKKILDVASGPGHHSVYFRSKGYEPVCLDNSKSMIKLCSERGLTSILGNMEDIDLSPKSFDGLWVYGCISHLKKEDFRKTITKLAGLLRVEGIFAVAIKIGKGEGFEDKPIIGNIKRWVSYYSRDEIVNAFTGFDIVYEKCTSPTGYDKTAKIFFRKNIEE